MDFALAAGGGFLVAVIWMDLMFDVLALRGRRGDRLPEEDLERIATYYARVTTTAWPMNLLVSAVMTTIVATLAMEWTLEPARRTVTAASLALCGVPIALALARVFPNAVRLGSRADDASVQSGLARGIAVAHLLCFAAMCGFLALRAAAGAS